MAKVTHSACPKCKPDLSEQRHFYPDGSSKPFTVLQDEEGNLWWHTPECEDVKKEFAKWEEI